MTDIPRTYPAGHDRPAKDPGGMVCTECGLIFIGEPYHDRCAICAELPAGRAKGEAAETAHFGPGEDAMIASCYASYAAAAPSPAVETAVTQAHASAYPDATASASHAPQDLAGRLEADLLPYLANLAKWFANRGFDASADKVNQAAARIRTLGDDVVRLTNQYADAESQLERAREALGPFVRWAADNVGDDGWEGLGCQKERIVDWFGPSDFRAARLAMEGGGDG